MRPRLFILSVSIIALAYACGGVDPDLIGADAGDEGDDSGSGKRDAGGSRDATVSDDSGSRTDGGVIVDSGAHDSGHDAGQDSGVISHADGGIVPCGDVGGSPLSCNSTNPTCCGIQYGPLVGMTDTFECTSTNDSCLQLDSGAMNVAVTCRDSTYCSGGNTCCGHIVSDRLTTDGYEFVQCQATCPTFDDAGNDNNYRIFCDPAGPADQCSDGQTCQASTLLPGFNVCL